MPPAKAAHLAGLDYAYRLWMEIEQANDECEESEGDVWLSVSEQFELAIAQARKDAKATTPNT
jgi:hypothetical protein